MRKHDNAPRELMLSAGVRPGIGVERGTTSDMGQLGIRIINIALFTTSCFFAAGVFNHIAENRLAPDYISALQPVARAEAAQPSWNERTAILDRNLFGAKVAVSKEPPEPEAEAPPPTEETKETKLPIELLGTVAGKPAALSTAVINNTRKKQHQVVRVGDRLDEFEHVKITAIDRRRVLLLNRDVTEELLLAETKPLAKAGASASRRPSRRSLPQRLKNRTSRRRNTPTPTKTPADDQEQLDRIQGAMTDHLIRNLEPAYGDDGKIDGVLVGDIEADGLLASAGLEANDVIESLNGIPIDSAGAAARVFRELSKCKPMTGSVRSAAGARTLEITQSMLSQLNCTN